ncbi:MAG TPA: DNA topoisomerase IB [Kiloniellales bacterium]|nr:DNA topoisomerase IB [Kiloniellales bacterium]
MKLESAGPGTVVAFAGGSSPTTSPALRMVAVEDLCLTRRRCGRGFAYFDARGRRISDKVTLDRLRGLAIPPAYAEVLIAPRANHHIQAVGRDEAGRLQYLYHPAWEAVREARKSTKLARLCTALPTLRRRLARILATPGLSREKALAAVIALIDRTHIRVGCDDYVHSGRSRGASTLLKRNVRIEGDRIFLAFVGKRRMPVQCSLRSPRLAGALEELRQLPGPRLFQYRNGDGALRKVSAAEVNAFLRELAEVEVTAKDFRTLAATAAAGERLCLLERAASASARKRQVAEVIRAVAALLANTPAIARKSYVHRELIDAFETGELARLAERTLRQRHLSQGEALVASLFPLRERAGSGTLAA